MKWEELDGADRSLVLRDLRVLENAVWAASSVEAREAAIEKLSKPVRQCSGCAHSDVDGQEGDDSLFWCYGILDRPVAAGFSCDQWEEG